MSTGRTPDAAGTYPPAVYAAVEDRRSAPPAGVLWWWGATILLGALVGLLWWLLAPTGRIFGDPSDPEQWLLRDLTLAGLGLLAGILVGAAVSLRLTQPEVPARLVAAVGGSVLGSFLALGVGQSLALLLGPDGVDDVPGSEFLLASYGALALWPAATAIIVFVAALVGLARRRD